jgi:hypothetical protein
MLESIRVDQFCCTFFVWIGHKKETLLAGPKRLQIQYIWIFGMQEIVLFVLGGVLKLLPKFSLHV